jgi:hypothetical protein
MVIHPSHFKAVFFFLALFTCANFIYGQSYLHTIHRISDMFQGGGSSSCVRTPDGNFIVVGDLHGRAGAIKITANGDTIWTKRYYPGENTSSTSQSIIATPDGNFIITGDRFLQTFDQEAYILKITPNGDTLWTRSVGNEGHSLCASAAAPGPDGNFVVTGWYDDVTAIFRISADGVIVSSRNISSGGRMATIIPTHDGNFIIAGFPAGVGRAALKIDPAGDTIWTLSLDNFNCTDILAIAPSGENVILAGGANAIINEGKGGQGILISVKPDGGIAWSRNFGSTGYLGLSAITPTSDGNFIAAGPSETSFDSTGIRLVKITNTGDTLWTRTFLRNTNTGVSSIYPTSDSTFIIVGGIYTEKDGYEMYTLTMIDDRYTKKSIPFSFRIPLRNPSAAATYTPLTIPNGMTISPDGVLSWTPSTDSVYTTGVAVRVLSASGECDTITFNVLVNSPNYTPAIAPPPARTLATATLSMTITSAASGILFSAGPDVPELRIFDIRGRHVETLPCRKGKAVWSARLTAGRYFAQISSGRQHSTQSFLVTR